ncbi:NUDIX hydrolase [Hyalangium versicolor]|uniref:NUDIX hydrolase n=1 Tax=Hyalangium versicolor TaxID=2861190 RepID=UPI001CCF76F2|nr:NUDIX hydrolase [Hyalangium versicolor]
MAFSRPPSAQPIPTDAKLVFRGVLFAVYQWEQRLYDGSKVVFEKVRRPDTVVVVPVLPDGRVLLTHQEQPGRDPFIGALGGRVNEGELPEEAARRELLEESGCEASELKPWFAVHPTTKVDWVVFAFVATGLRQTTSADLDPGERIKLVPTTFDDFLTLAHDPRFIEKEMVPLLLEAKYCESKRAAMRSLFGCPLNEDL